jgi:hypothetical protein
MRHLISTQLRSAALVGLVILPLLGGGCVPVSHSSVSSVGGEAAGARLDRAPTEERVAALAREFRALGPDVSPDEADLVASVAVRYSEQLADAYDMVRPVELHNVLVNLRLRRGGLCYQMAECMLAELRELPVRTLEFRRAIAWRGDLWNEHNTIVVAAVGAPFESGVVLDAWRNAGRLRWAPVRLDHYPWRPKAAPPGERVIASRPAPPPPAPAGEGDAITAGANLPADEAAPHEQQSPEPLGGSTPSQLLSSRPGVPEDSPDPSPATPR